MTTPQHHYDGRSGPGPSTAPRRWRRARHGIRRGACSDRSHSLAPDPASDLLGHQFLLLLPIATPNLQNVVLALSVSVDYPDQVSGLARDGLASRAAALFFFRSLPRTGD